ncbi:hypothetical protein [Litoreibacter roseus]|nr:hypothetical protein [Litoreibacter roseus]
MPAPWTIRIRGDAGDRDRSASDFRFEAVLRVTDLEERIAGAILTREKQCSYFADGEDSPGQPAVELKQLRRFSKRLEQIENRDDLLKIEPGELPISFNDDLFAGDYIEVTCGQCGKTSGPEAAVLVPFSDDDHMQYYGDYRCCDCGGWIATKIRGQRRP